MKTTDSSTNTGKSKPSRKRSVKIATVIFNVSILLLIGTVVYGLIYVNSKLDLINYVSPDEAWPPVSAGDIEDLEDDSLKADPDAVVILPEEDLFSDSNVLNILLMGTDERVSNLSIYARSDSMLLLSLNRKTYDIKLVSLERGMNVRMPDGEIDVLTNVFRYGGPDWVISCVQSHFNLDVEKYIRVNFSVFQKIVDAVGGVDIELTRIEADALNHVPDVETNTFPLSYRVRPGMNHLDGFGALQYCRLRYTDSDWVRIVRQRKTIAAIKDQCQDLSLSEINELADTVLPMVSTNLSKDEVVSLLLSFPQFVKSDIEDMTIPAEGTFTYLSRVDFEANSKILRDFLYEDEEE